MRRVANYLVLWHSSPNEVKVCPVYIQYLKKIKFYCVLQDNNAM
jgi:hypothetical protein